MRHRPNQRGFTIIETMIFLTVSSVVFLGAIQQYSGQQRVVLASQGFRTLQSQLTSLANEVASSNSPDLGAVHCHGASDNKPLLFSPGGMDNSDCTFLGKTFSFGAPAFCDDSNADSCGKYFTAPVVGRRLFYAVGDTKGTDVTTFSQAQPVLLASSPDLSDDQTLLNGIGIYKAYVRKADGSNAGDPDGIGAFAFILSLTGEGGSSGQVDLLALDTHFKGTDKTKTATAVAALKDVDSTTFVAGSITRINPQYGIALCLTSGNGQHTEITVGANKSPVDVQVVPTTKIDAECNL